MLGYNYTYQGDYLDERTGRVTYAQSLNDATLDRSYEYDNAGRLAISHTGAEARAHVGLGQWGTLDGPYSQGYDYDVWGNVTHKYGWGGEVQGGTAGQSSDIYYSYTNNRRNGFTYDAAGNLSNDGQQSFSYDATGQQSYAAGQIGGGSPPGFTDDPLVAGQTIIKAAHLTELRTAVNQARARAGLAAATWAEAITSGVLIKAAHIVELRARLDEARSALGLSAATYTDAGLSLGYTVKAAHVQELRERVKEALGPVPTTLYQYYDGDGLRVKKTENGATTYYLRSSVLGGQVVAELNGSGGWTRGYVYQGSSLLAVQQGGVFWMHEDPVTKSKRMTNSAGAIVSTVELDPWGADTNRSSSSAFQPKKFTSYDRDVNGTDEAMFRRFNRKNSRFDQPDPYDGSYDLSDPQSFNRYAYVNGDPVNYVDPTGLWADATSGDNAGCRVDGIPMNCSQALGLVNMGAATVSGGSGFYLGGSVLVLGHVFQSDHGSWYSQSVYFMDPQNTLTIENFNAAQESWIRYELARIFTTPCDAAYHNERLNSPSDIKKNRGIVIRPATDIDRSAADLHLDAPTYRSAQATVYRGQGSTVYGTDGTLQIYLNTTAFLGPTWDGRLASLAEVLKHEFIHEGIREWSSPWHPGSHDLRGFPGYDRIMAGCK